MSDERVDCKYLGKIIGTMSGWDTVGDSTDLIFYDFIPNELGNKFLKDYTFEEGEGLIILLSDGIVEGSPEEGEHTQINPDWSVFNNG